MPDLVPKLASNQSSSRQTHKGNKFAKRLHLSARKDFYISTIILVLLTSLTIFLEIEIVEDFYEFTRKHEKWELDEILAAVLWAGLISIIYGIRRIIDIRKLNKEISLLAFYDHITKLPNRALAIDRLDQLIAIGKKRKELVGVLFIDFDNFKMVNDTHGHAMGDLLIKSVAQRLESKSRQIDIIARLGGDEFVVLLPKLRTEEDAIQAATRLLALQDTPHILDKIEIYISFSIGIAIYPQDGENTEELLNAADAAMYKSKKEGKGSFHLYNNLMRKRSQERYAIQTLLRNAIENEEFHLVFQPEVNSETGEIETLEALLRWEHDGEFIPPDKFINVAEETGDIHKIGHWVLEKACRLASQRNLIKVAVNISPMQLKQSNFYQQVETILQETGLPPSRLELELTETSLIADFDSNKNKLQLLRKLGVSLAIDDFGTGYSSLGRLRELHVDKLKIDRSFIQDLEFDQTSITLVKSVITLAHNMGMKATAEGVENAQQLSLLKTYGCDVIQGFYLAKPSRLEHLPTLIDSISTKLSQYKKQPQPVCSK